MVDRLTQPMWDTAKQRRYEWESTIRFGESSLEKGMVSV